MVGRVIKLIIIKVYHHICTISWNPWLSESVWLMRIRKIKKKMRKKKKNEKKKKRTENPLFLAKLRLTDPCLQWLVVAKLAIVTWYGFDRKKKKLKLTAGNKMNFFKCKKHVKDVYEIRIQKKFRHGIGRRIQKHRL